MSLLGSPALVDNRRVNHFNGSNAQLHAASAISYVEIGLCGPQIPVSARCWVKHRVACVLSSRESPSPLPRPGLQRRRASRSTARPLSRNTSERLGIPPIHVVHGTCGSLVQKSQGVTLVDPRVSAFRTLKCPTNRSGRFAELTIHEYTGRSRSPLPTRELKIGQPLLRCLASDPVSENLCDQAFVSWRVGSCAGIQLITAYHSAAGYKRNGRHPTGHSHLLLRSCALVARNSNLTTA